MHLSRLEGGRGNRHSRLLVSVGLDGCYTGDANPELIEQADGCAGFFDQHLPRPPSFCQVFDLGFQVRVVDTASPEVEEIPVAVVCPKPRGADRPIIVGAALCGRVPTLQDKLAEGCRGWFSVALNPLA